MCSIFLVAQEKADKGEKVSQTFKDTRVVNGHSVETNKLGQLKFIIAHRFGTVNGGIKELYGLDQSTIRLGFDYGLLNWLTIGVGRSSFEKTVDGFVKAKLVHQRENGAPISVTWLSTAAVNTMKNLDRTRDIPDRTRWTYTNQALIARKFSDAFSLQLMPTHVHRNLVHLSEHKNDIISIGAAGKLQLTKILSFKTEYYYSLDNQLPDDITNSLALGFDIETKHHVFQLHLSNSRGMIEKFFITETRGEWDKGDIMIGFNITRDFQIKGRKYK